jgi:hypothetical protein
MTEVFESMLVRRPTLLCDGEHETLDITTGLPKTDSYLSLTPDTLALLSARNPNKPILKSLCTAMTQAK